MSKILNVEMKAKCHQPDKIHEYLRSKGAIDKGVDHQIDRYFDVERGRLKLRSGNIENSLIYYERENLEGPKSSLIELYKTMDPKSLSEVLDKVLPLKVVVDKKRHIYFIENVKFHVDEVEQLGSFVEIEAIDEDGIIGLEKLNQQCSYYLKELEIKDADLINVSYSDMILGLQK